MNLTKFISTTRHIAEQHQTGRCFHVAFVLHKNKLLSIGWNQKKTHPNNIKLPYRAPTVDIHAEHAAIIRCKRKTYRHCSMVVIRINNNGVLDNSRPCAGCLQLLKEKEFKHVYYSTMTGFKKL